MRFIPDQRGLVAAALAVLLLLPAGCASRQTVLDDTEAAADEDEPQARAAVLPFANDTNTVAAPEIVRGMLFEEAKRRGWALQRLKETDRRLREDLQITDGGQLEFAEPSGLGESLAVPALFYGHVLEWKKITVGVYNTVLVKVHVRLVDAGSGTVQWERTREVSQRMEVDLEHNVGANILYGALVNLLLNPMTPYARQVMREIGMELPPPRAVQ